MIGRLRGTLLEKHPNLALVECAGVGYACQISLGTYGLLPEAGAEAVLHVETLLRENELALLGFASRDERELYRLLVKVDGIGPKLALAALGALPLDDLFLAIRGRDIKTLQRVPGVGKRPPKRSASNSRKSSAGCPGWRASPLRHPPPAAGRATSFPRCSIWASRKSWCGRWWPSYAPPNLISPRPSGRP